MKDCSLFFVGVSMTTKEVPKVKPGYQIRVVDEKSIVNGNEYLVVKCPPDKPESLREKVWVVPMSTTNCQPAYLTSNFAIVSRGNPSKKHDVDVSLDKERDNNLAGFFQNYLDYK